MPFVLVEVRKHYSKEQTTDLIDRIQKALQETFKISNGDICVRLITYDPSQFVVSKEIAHSECYTIITIDCFLGRSLDTKRLLYQRIVEELIHFGIPKETVKILLRETVRENWGIRGGQAASDIDLGYSITI